MTVYVSYPNVPSNAVPSLYQYTLPDVYPPSSGVFKGRTFGVSPTTGGTNQMRSTSFIFSVATVHSSETITNSAVCGITLADIPFTVAVGAPTNSKPSFVYTGISALYVP